MLNKENISLLLFALFALLLLLNLWCWMRHSCCPKLSKLRSYV